MSKVDSDIMDEPAGRRRKVLAIEAEMRRHQEIIRIETENAEHYERLAAIKPSIDSDMTDEKHWERREQVLAEAHARRVATAERIAQENAAQRERLAAIKPSIDSDMTDEGHWQRRERVLADAKQRRKEAARQIARENEEMRERLAAIKSPGRQRREAGSRGASPMRPTSRPHSAYPEYAPPINEPSEFFAVGPVMPDNRPFQAESLVKHDSRPLDEALQALRAQLPSSMRPQSAPPPSSMYYPQPTNRPQSPKPLQRPSLAPPPTPPAGSSLLYMAPFYNSAIRDARVRHGPHKDWSKVKPNKARPDTIRPIGASREKPRDTVKKLQPGARPYGYRIQSCHPSAPAVTICGRIALHPDVDPDAPDIEIPGPGRYDMLKY